MARNKTPLSYNGAEVCLFQDLSTITLQCRRELCPLLEVLCMKGIPYRWKFPFCLSASFQGRTALLKVPEDLYHFCATLDSPMTEVPEWYAEFRHPSAKPTLSRTQSMQTQDYRYCRQRSPSDSCSHQSAPALITATVLRKLRKTRRARLDR